LMSEFVAKVQARNTERKETARAGCQILRTALVIATLARGGDAAPSETRGGQLPLRSRTGSSENASEVRAGPT
jgi:hypothetical protein